MTYSKSLDELVKPDWLTDEVWQQTLDNVQSLERIRTDAKAHLKRYLATGGKDGYMMGPYPVVVLTTIGRKSGKEITTPLNFVDTGNNSYMVVGSLAGNATDPQWALNLKANPKAWLQVKDQRWEAEVKEVSPEEREQLWSKAVRAMPLWEVFQQRTDRKFPLFIIKPKL